MSVPKNTTHDVSHRYRVVTNQQQFAHRVLTESERIREASDDISLQNRKETDFRLQERLNDLDFIKKEIEKTRKEICLELEALNTYKERLSNCIKSVEENLLQICRKCIKLRHDLLGNLATHDHVERELLNELETIQGVLTILHQPLEQTKEQIRRIKAQSYVIDRDLQDKTQAIKLDYLNSSLNEKKLNLDQYRDHPQLIISTISLDEWNEFTKNNLAKAIKELKASTPLRSFIDTTITQCARALEKQVRATNVIFQRNIKEMQDAKIKLEVQHAETLRMASEMLKNISELEVALAKEEEFMALAQTRLRNRAQRPGVELCHDKVEMQLINETATIDATIRQLQQQLAEAQTSLRYLMRCQIQLEEDINLKMNLLKIDEVDCMTLRQSMNVAIK